MAERHNDQPDHKAIHKIALVHSPLRNGSIFGFGHKTGLGEILFIADLLLAIIFVENCIVGHPPISADKGPGTSIIDQIVDRIDDFEVPVPIVDFADALGQFG